MGAQYPFFQWSRRCPPKGASVYLTLLRYRADCAVAKAYHVQVRAKVAREHAREVRVARRLCRLVVLRCITGMPPEAPHRTS
jgi:hypothetical protein